MKKFTGTWCILEVLKVVIEYAIEYAWLLPYGICLMSSYLPACCKLWAETPAGRGFTEGLLNLLKAGGYCTYKNCSSVLVLLFMIYSAGLASAKDARGRPTG